MDLKKQILSALGLDKEEELNLEFQAKLIDGTIVVSKADELAEGVEVMILAEDGSTMPVPVGTYETEDGVEFKVEKEGIVASMEKKETEEEEEETEEKEEVEAVEEEEMSEETVEETEEVENENFDKNALIEEIGVVIKELLEEVRSDVSRLSAELEEMKDINGELTTEKEELQSQIVELSKEPATKPVEVSKFNETKLNTKPYANMNSKERFYYNLNK
tara:strand:+ start:147 stop:803 length:657 start_codon:yes stop_codon:yes gene_type:complete